MRVFISAGEPSGDLHGSNFAKALRAAVPSATISGFGGPRLVNAGQEQLFPLADHAVMGLWRVLVALPQFYSYFKLATKEFDTHRPDAVVLVDYPGFHWHIAKAAHLRGIPVYWFVPPQIWAWATHRVKRMRQWVDHVFCNLPFETEWYQSRGVKCSFIGHPYFDALAEQRLEESFVTQQQQLPGRRVALLPGSRTHEVHDNFPMMLRTAELMLKEKPGLRFLVAGFKEKQTTWMKNYLEQQHPHLPVEIHLGRTPEIIHLGEVCLAVSGSVSLELLHATIPTVTLYRISPIIYPLVMKFKHARYISLINLLANREISPEFLTKRDDSRAMAGQLTHWLHEEAERQAVKAAMHEVKAGVARTGACARAVAHLLDTMKTLKRAA